MTPIDIPLVGGTYQARSVPVGNQHTKNFYIEVDPHSNEPALMPFPGSKLWSTVGNGPIRGSIEYRSELYVVSGDTFYNVSANGTASSIGTILGSGSVSMATDGTNIVIAIGSGKPYSWNGGTLTQGADPDLPDANTVIYINDRFIYDRPDGLAFSDLNSPLVVDSSNVLNSNTIADDTVAVRNRAQQILSIGETSVEPINFTGSGSPPYSRINSAIIEGVGTEAPYSVANNKDYIYFLGKDRAVYRMKGYTPEVITNPAIGQVITEYASIADAVGLCFNFDSQFFYYLTFPTEGQSWLFSQNAGEWTNLGYQITGSHLANTFTHVYDKRLIGSRIDGKIFELDFDTYTDDSNIIQRIRTTREIKAKDFGLPDRPMTMASLELRIEPGTSVPGSESQIIMEYSDDSGKTWSSERFADVGEHGEFDYVLRWMCLGSFKRRIFRFKMSDAIKWVLTSLTAEVEVGI